MRRRSKTWRVAEDAPTDLLIALYLRDAAGLAPAGSLPAIEPSVAPPFSDRYEPAPGRIDALHAEWTAWWQRLLAPADRPKFWNLEPPTFDEFEHEPELRQLLMARFQVARRWAGTQHEAFGDASVLRIQQGEYDINGVVVACERSLGRKAEAFALDLAVLPLAERGIWIVGPNRLVVTTSLRADSGAFREAMAPIIAAVA